MNQCKWFFDRTLRPLDALGVLVLALFLLISLSFFQRVFAAGTVPVSSPDIKNKLQQIASKNKLPALGAVKVHASGEIEYASYGKRGDGEPVDQDAVWHIGSITKSMTATLALLMNKQGAINLQTKPEDVWPDIVLHPSLKGVKLIDLLRHRSGITEDTPSTTDWRARFKDERPYPLQRKEWVSSILSKEKEVSRGTFLYSNAGYVVAGAMLEAVSQKSFELLLNEHVFRPLAMREAGFGAPEGESALWGHKDMFLFNWAQKPGPMADNPLAMAPAGGVHLSLSDMAKYIKLHLGFYPDMLSLEDLAILHMPRDDEDYALGWKVFDRPWAEGPALHHAGSNTMWMANVWLAPNKKIGFFAVTNVGGKNAFLATDQAVAMLLTED